MKCLLEGIPSRGPGKQCLRIAEDRFTARTLLFTGKNRINVGFAAEKVLKDLKPTIQASEIRFRKETKHMLVSLIQNAFGRSLRKYKLTQTIS